MAPHVSQTGGAFLSLCHRHGGETDRRERDGGSREYDLTHQLFPSIVFVPYRDQSETFANHGLGHPLALNGPRRATAHDADRPSSGPDPARRRNNITANERRRLPLLATSNDHRLISFEHSTVLFSLIHVNQMGFLSDLQPCSRRALVTCRRPGGSEPIRIERGAEVPSAAGRERVASVAS